MNMKKILIPVDASENSKRAVEQGKLLAKTFGSDVVLLNVINISYFYFNYDANVPQISLLTIIEEEKKHSQELLDGYKASFGEMADKVETVVLQGATANEILEYSHKCDVDLIVMGSRGVGSALKVAMMGSVANKVLHNSDKPVLIVK
jgi:nucleotide-binding universal stress UspA family protein